MPSLRSHLAPRSPLPHPSRAAGPALIAALCLCLGPPRAHAATPPAPELNAGVRVRIAAPGLSESRVVGRLVAVDADTLTFVPAGATEATPVPLADVSKLEVSVARRNYAGRGMLLGGLLGAALGGALVATQQLGADVSEELIASYQGYAPPHHVVSKNPLIVGAAAGAAIGGVCGWVTTSEVWVAPAAPPARLALGAALDGRARLMITVAF